MIKEELDKIKSKQDVEVFKSLLCNKKFIEAVKALDGIQNAMICDEIKDKAKLVGKSDLWKDASKYFKAEKETKQNEIPKNIHSNFYLYKNKNQEINFFTSKWLIDEGNNSIYKENKGDEGIASYEIVLVTKRLINIETNEQKFEITYKDKDKWYSFTQPRSTFSTRNISKLSDYGITIAPQNSINFCNYIADLYKSNEYVIPTIKSISRLGWVDDTFKQFLPITEGEIICDCEKEYEKILEILKPKGSFEIWQQNVLQARENKIVRIYTDASFASALIKVLGINGYLVHLYGDSGKGKSVSLKIAMSIWGSPKKGHLFNGADATKFGLERRAEFLQNIPLSGDEILKRDTKEITLDDLIYMISNGSGRARGSKDGGVQRQSSWNLIMMTTSEMPITSDVSASGAKVRCIELQNSKDMFSKTEQLPILCDTIEKNYGHAGKKFVELITKLGKEELCEKFNEIKKEAIELSSKPLDEKQLNAVASIKLADDLVSEEILKTDSQLSLEDILILIKDTDEIDIGKRARDLVISQIQRDISTFQIVGSGYNNPFEGRITTINGKINLDKRHIVANLNYVVDCLKSRGIDFNQVKDKWINSNVIKRYGKPNPYYSSNNGKNFIKFLNTDIELEINDREDDDNDEKPF